jgi:uncharacterized protein RhaS with RHS repeats
LYHTDYREYHCTLGRFVQVDPIGPAGGPNPYEYCSSRPAVTVDPSGLIDWEKLQEGIWDAGKSESDFLAAMPVDGLDSADTRGLIDADAGFLEGLVTAAEGVSGADLSALRALIRKGRSLENRDASGENRHASALLKGSFSCR